MNNPLDVVCPHCEAVPGKRCVIPGSNQSLIRKSGKMSIRTSHKERFEAAEEEDDARHEYFSQP